MKYKLILAVLILFFISPYSGIAQRTKLHLGEIGIAIVKDGPSDYNKFFDTTVQKEISTLLKDIADITYYSGDEYTGDWSMRSIHNINNRLLNDSKIDIIIDFGVLASDDIARRGPLNKPAIAAFIINSETQKIPITRERTSGINNLYFIQLIGDYKKDIKMYRDLVPFDTVYNIRSKIYEDEIKFQELEFEDTDSIPNIHVNHIDALYSADDVLKQIPDFAEAVYLGPMLHFPITENKKIIDDLYNRKIPLFTYNEYHVQGGALACTNPLYINRLMKRIAVSILDILFGTNPSILNVDLMEDRGYYINMNTFNRLGLKKLTWDIITESVLLGFEELSADTNLKTLKDVLLVSLDNNLDVWSKKYDIKSSEEDIRTARSELLPQLSVELDGILNSSTQESTPERIANFSLSLQQLIYSVDRWGNYNQSKEIKNSKESNLESTRLDITNQTASSYIDIIKLRKLFFINTENLLTLRSSLDAANKKFDIGLTSLDEVLRWQSEVTLAKKSTVDIYSYLIKSAINLERIARLTELDAYDIVDISYESPNLLTSRPEFTSIFDNPYKTEKLKSFYIDEALANSPEIKSIEHLMSATEIQIKATHLIHFIPMVSAYGKYINYFAKSDIFMDIPLLGRLPASYPNYIWTVGINLSLPIFKGFAIQAAEEKAKVQLSQFKTSRQQITDNITANIRSTLEDIQSSYFSIKQMKIAEETAKGTLDLMNTRYLLGTATILDLLDAQRTYLQARQNYTTVYYEFIKNYFNLQRAIGKYDIFMTSTERDNYMKRINDYMMRE